ncbi:class IIb bacteriocin, lactobin A/cerein 7B family [Prochlorococcus marinus]|uniref:class IIb bacteriocin, lactobin A/cerein 7B family n=1 Tax=Prochlorococcus marinus TaxID=1219 RepID=UPI0022B4FD7C|nr:class IIb bacteriocin, lactobin A/cerein 7B family [Prochlorococcus marinus]
MTTSYVIETVDQELQLSDLQSINGGVIPVAGAYAIWAVGIATGALAKTVYDMADREKIADAVHDLISSDDNSSQKGGKGRKGRKGGKGRR